MLTAFFWFPFMNPSVTTMRHQAFDSHYDAIVIGSGHNGLVAAAYLAKAGKSVLVLERNDYLGGATASQRVFPDYEAWLSRYSYLVSLLPQQIVQELNLDFATRRRSIASFTPYTDAKNSSRGLLLSNVDADISRNSMREMAGDESAWNGYQRLIELNSAIASVAWPTFMEPLKSRDFFRKSLTTELQRNAWKSFVERPLGETLELITQNDTLRGLLMTDAKIGVLTHPHDSSLLQNRCYLYHVIGGATGEWRVPVGGMVSLVRSLVKVCRENGVVMLTNAIAEQVSSTTKGASVCFRHMDKEFEITADSILINAAPKTFCRLLGQDWQPIATDEGSVIKVNMLLRRLPRVKAHGIDARQAFSGSFHIDEGYEQMLESYRQAVSGSVPDFPPAEIYCHTLTDDSILSAELRDKGFQTLTLFGLDMPYRIFQTDHDQRRDAVLAKYLAALNRICDEPFEDCLAKDGHGNMCIEIKTPQDLEREIDLDLGNIFHNTLSWFFAVGPEEVGKWGVETEFPNVYRAGSSAARGGAVSGIPGRNAAMCVLAREH